MADGFSLEKSLRTTVLAMRIADAHGVPASTRAPIFWTTLLRFAGCMGFAHEEGSRFAAGDDLSLRATLAYVDFGRPVDFLRRAVAGIAPHAALAQRVVALGRLLGTPSAPRAHAHAQCEVGVAVARDLGMDDAVVAALALRDERWDGRGPRGLVRGDELPIAARIADVADVVELFAWAHGLEAMRDELARRRGGALEPALVDTVLRDVGAIVADVFVPSVWEPFLAAEPEPRRRAADEASLTAYLAAFSRFADVSSVFTLDHSKRVAHLAGKIAVALGGSDADARLAERAGYSHDLGRVAVPIGIWEKPGALTPFEQERVRTHSQHTETILRLAPALGDVADVAAATHERGGGRGYHRRLELDRVSLAGRALAVADVYVALDSERPHRPRQGREAIARELRTMAAEVALDPQAVRAALELGGHAAPRRAADRTGLTERERTIVRLVAIGRTNREIGALLGISPRTAQKHVMNVYQKIGRESRAGLALWAVDHGLLDDHEKAPR